ncbi:site-specific DNA-methyltransferase, partial [Mucilaginibacter sp.]|uniref:site-specific DNA-methyltransferase n=1 Tax=Mucilaginibacter sp. TaxID=1882438 RepID=UPI002ED16E9C
MPTLTWIGKDKVVTHHHDVPFKVLNHQYTFGSSSYPPTETSNKIIHGDNLEALKALLPEYEGKIKCIYIDPPYNTGNENWVYNDNVSDPRLRRWLGEVVGTDDLSRHDKWLCMMYPRLVLLHKLLAKDGAIFISIDDNEQSTLKLICDEIFGIGNFVNNIIWQKKFSPQNDARYFSDNHDFILCYTKDKSIWVRNLLNRTNEQNARYDNRDNDYRGPWTSGDISVKTYSAANDYPITTPSGRIVNPPSGYCWRFSEEKLTELIRDHRIWFGVDNNNVPRYKRFLSDVQQGTVPLTIWPHSEVGHNQYGKQELKKIFHDSIPFDTPKPPTLIQRILEIATSPNSIILDSFAGSGTTAHAVLNLNKQDGGNRKFILIEMEDYAETITAERVKRVMKGYNGKEDTGGSFDYYTLGEPLFTGENKEYLNEAVGIDKIKNYIWYSETRSPWTASTTQTNDLLLGV